jgi:hypothetical protein
MLLPYVFALLTKILAAGVGGLLLQPTSWR